MVETRTLRLLEVAWEGPLSIEEVALLDRPSDRGVLQVYGSHPVFGGDALLYIAEARSETFAQRLERLGHWLRFLPSAPTHYVGRLGGTAPPGPGELDECIRVAFRLLTFFHAPAWNSREIDHHGISIGTVVLNMGHRHRLALEVSTLWDSSAWEPDGSAWEPWVDPPSDPEPAAGE